MDSLERTLFYKLLMFPVVVLVLGCIPGLNLFLYSGHGGVFWFVLPLCFPYILVRLTIALWRSESAKKSEALKASVFVVLTYLIIAYPLTRWTEYYVSSTLGIPIRAGTLFRLAIFPIGLLLPHYHSGGMFG